ncbi:MAG: marine proteobacterial sortase target protein [Nitrospira sp. CR1.1]|nr:marine proteobacterial sortase target protein [Nitrospira sp. CR1.1]
MMTEYLSASRSWLHRMTSGFLFCVVLSALAFGTHPPEARSAESAATLRTGVVPTMGINEVTEGTLLFRTNQAGRFSPAPILKTDVQIAVTGTIARATVRQEFTNPSTRKGDWLEGIYVFPLPETAAVDHLRMKVGERTIEGQIKERAEARKVYDQAKQQGKRTSLLDQERPNMFTASVANIGPGEHITIEIEYQETVRYDADRFQLRFPMAVGQRYIPGTPVIIEGQAPKGSGTMLDTDRVPDASRMTPPVQSPAHGSMNPVSLSLTLHPGFPIDKVESPFHPIITIPDAEGGFHISLRADAVPGDRDFQLIWHPAPRSGPIATVFTEQKNGETYAMLMLVPPTQQDEKAQRIPRDLTFIIDTSGSMAGASIDQAKRALAGALTRLTTQDRFNVIQFNTIVRSLFSVPQPVTTTTIKQAVRYTEQLSADGGTEVLPALRQALKSPQDSSRLQQIILLTDGQVGNEEELFELLHQRVGTRRLFTVGIGSTPNSHLMRKAAEFGRGTFTYIGKVDEVEQKLERLFKKLERPVLGDIALDPAGWSGLEHYPAKITDLYEGEPIVLALKADALPSHAMLRGQAGGHPWSLPVPLNQTSAYGGLSVYWARQKISSLMDEAYKGGSDEATKTSVLEVALAHHLVSQYTSLVAVDITPVRPTDAPGEEQGHATNLASAQDLGALPKTATGWQLHLLLGFSAVVLAAWLRALRIGVA